MSLRPVCWLPAVLSRTRLPELSMLTSLVPELASQSLLNSTLFQQYLHHSINSAFASLHSGLCEQQSLEQSESLHAMADGGQDLPSVHECLAFISQQTHRIHTRMHTCRTTTRTFRSGRWCIWGLVYILGLSTESDEQIAVLLVGMDFIGMLSCRCPISC